MKRFFCSICKRTIRVRKLPPTIDTPNAVKVTDRVGVCRSHEGKWESAQVARKVGAK